MEWRLPGLWILLLGLVVLVPGSASRFLLDVLGGLTLLVLVLPLIAAGFGILAWKTLRRRLRTCPACGLTSLARGPCPACGAPLPVEGDALRTGDEASSHEAGQSFVRLHSPLTSSAGSTGFDSGDVRNLTIDVDASAVVDHDPSKGEPNPLQKHG